MTKPRGGVAGEHERKQLPLFVAPTTAGTGANALSSPIVPLACWRLEDVRFEFDSSVVKPDARAELVLLAALYRRIGDPTASVFGHADPVGDDGYNKTLSGRRAAAVYGLLTRDLELWDQLYSQPFSTDNWQTALPMMRATTGQPDGASRKDVFAAYMDAICTDADGKPFVIAKSEFVGGGGDAGGKGDYQGCSEFNPILLFSTSEAQALQAVPAERNRQNGPNRRVMVFLFPPGFHVAPAAWPCPRVKEPVSGCKPHQWPDGDQRRASGPVRREYERDHDTFACAFYDGMARRSPCEVVRKTLQIRLMDAGGQPIANAPYRVDAGGDRREGTADAGGYLREPDLVAPDQVTIAYADPAIHGDLRPYRAIATLGLAERRDDESFLQRLENLGYGRTTLAGDAIACFQRDHALEPTRTLDAATKDALVAAHDDGAPRPAPPPSPGAHA